MRGDRVCADIHDVLSRNFPHKLVLGRTAWERDVVLFSRAPFPVAAGAAAAAAVATAPAAAAAMQADAENS